MVFFFETPWLVIRAMSKDDDVESGEVRAVYIFWLLLWLSSLAAIFKKETRVWKGLCVLLLYVIYIYIWLGGGG